MNLRWSWDAQTRDLFRWVDPDAWDATVHDPVAPARPRVRASGSTRWSTTPASCASSARCATSSSATSTATAGSRPATTSPLRSVAYFSPEFGIAEALPQYSGGLGVLAGDHLKAASDLGVPLVGIGLFYRHGYFRQSLNADGWQQERYPDLDPHAMALTPCDGVARRASTSPARRSSRRSGGPTSAACRSTCSTPTSRRTPDDVRDVTDRLYGGDTEHRLRQEILLGIGGVRALDALGIDAQVFHTNEGHAGFLGLERIRQLVDGRRALATARRSRPCAPACIFTTHTPVPAGIDRFPRELIEQYFAGWAERGAASPSTSSWRSATAPATTPDERVQHGGDGPAPGRAGPTRVAKLHGDGQPRDVHRPLARRARPTRCRSRRSPTACTPTRGCRPRWPTCSPATCCPSGTRPTPSAGRGSTTPATTSCGGRASRAASGWSRSSASGCASQLHGPRPVARATSRGPTQVLDPEALTIGFARRFATYKRATLLLSQPDRLSALLLSADRPVQFVFAGKAHPADDRGKELIRQISAVRRRPRRPPPVRVRRRLRHRRRPRPAARAPTCGSTTRAGRRRRAARPA